jgi:hypothetical protein
MYDTFPTLDRLVCEILLVGWNRFGLGVTPASNIEIRILHKTKKSIRERPFLVPFPNLGSTRLELLGIPFCWQSRWWPGI